uniref:Fatty acid desaturase D6 n=1 Tax=Tribolium castaneum TaxID=7070 RepID=A0A096XDB2_TRICA|nr:fatty acid desaturase D6 [Tribolium castaneum]
MFLRTITSKFYSDQIVWRNVFLLLILHIISLQGWYFVLTTTNWPTLIYGFIFGALTGQGIKLGAHRLWAHRCYKAKLPLRIFLCFLQTVTLQNPLYEWVRDHQVHHKYTDTNADPLNATRGFFFSHMGWLLVRKHPNVIAKGKTLDLSDLEEDPVVMFQKKYYKIIAPVLTLAIPALIPWYFFGEDLYLSWVTTCVLPYFITLHSTWAVNSVAHIWGTKPYNKNILPTENIAVAIVAYGEGWHNYHHVFPWDYKAAELGNYRPNLSTAFIDFMAKIAWAYDLKSVSPEMLRKRKMRTGDCDY